MIVNSIAALRGVDKTLCTQASVASYYGDGVGPSSPYWYDSTDTTTADDGGTVIVATDGGRWKLLHNGTVTIRQFGAPTNVAGCQAALTAAAASGGTIQRVVGTPGLYLLAAPLVISGRVDFDVMDGCEFKMQAGAFANVLQNSCFANMSTNGINVTGNVFWPYTSGGLAYWEALIGGIATTLNLAICDYVWLTGADQMAYRGVFPVIAISGTDVTVKLDRKPLAGPTGTMTVRKADMHIKVTGGIWNKNNTDNHPGISDTRAHTIVMAGTHGLKLHDIETKDQDKFGICLAASDTFELDDIRDPYGNSDLIKIYGPAFRGKVRKVRGYPGDDFFSLHNGENPLWPGYFIDQGDVRNIDVDDLGITHGIAGAAIMTSIYPQGADSRIEGIKLRNYSGSTQGAAIQIYDIDGGNQVGDVTIENFNAVAAQPLLCTTKVGTTSTIQSVRFEPGPNCRSLGGNHVVTVDTGMTVETLEIAAGRINTTTMDDNQLLRVNGDVYHVIFNDLRYTTNVSALMGFSTATHLLKSMAINNCNLETANSMFPWSAITLSQAPTIRVQGGRLKATSLFEVASTMNISFHGTRLEHSLYAVYAYGGTAPLVELHSEGSQLVSGSWANATGDAMISPKSFEITNHLTSTYLKRAAGNRMSAINGAGTIPNYAPCICDETGLANSWHSIKNPTVEMY